MKTRIFSSTLALAAILSAAALPVSAQIGIKATISADTGAKSSTTRASSTSAAKLDATMDRGEAQVENRIDSLLRLQSRIQGMKHLTETQKAAFAASIQTQITSLNAMLVTIKNATSTASLRTSLQAFMSSHRINALVEPQLSIVAAGDRIGNIVISLQALAAKFDARIAAGASTTASTSAKLADLKAKTGEASLQSQAAISGVMSLQPDQGDKTVQASNTAALKAARAKIKLAMQAVQTAYADARAVAQSLKVSGGASASSTNSMNLR